MGTDTAVLASTTDILSEAGYGFGPPLAALFIVGLAVYIRWRQGHREFRNLLVNWSVLAGGMVCLVGIPLFYRHWGVPPPFHKNEIGILIAGVPGDTKREQQISYALAIRNLLAHTPELAGVVEVRLLERPLPHDAERQHVVETSIGRRLRASFVLSALPVAGGYQLWLTAIQPRPEGIDTVPLPSDATSLARCAVALSYYHRGVACSRLPGPDHAANLRQAVHSFEQALPVFEAQGLTQYAAAARRELANLAGRR